MSNIVCCVSFFILCFSQVYVWSVLYNEKIDYRKKSFYFPLLFMFIFGIINYFYVSAFLRMILNTVIFSVCNFLIFKKKLNEVVVNTLYSYFLLTLSDIILSFVLIGLMKLTINNVIYDSFITYTGNIFVSILLFFLSHLLILKKFYNKLIDLTHRIKIKYLTIICFFVIISVNFLMATIYFHLSSIFVVFINTFLIIVYSFIIYNALNEKNNSMMIKAENDSLMYSLHQYEDMVDRQRVDNHENKNQLLIIKNMIKKNDKDVVKYIDTIVKDEKEDDEALYTRVKTIPSGGLQGIIYQKMLVMKDEKIVFSLDVSRDVRKIDLDDFSMEDNYRLCKIVGVLLDNAIEESRKIDDKCIMISLYVDDGKLVIDVSNRFSGKVDLDKLDEEGYTTKGDGHGYGLSLVKKIMSETDIFENERSIKKDVFKQVIKVKIKNT